MNVRSTAMTMALLFVSALAPSAPAQTVTAPDLKTLAGGKGWTVFNRTVTVREQAGRTVAEFDAKPGDGMAWLDGLSFTRGEIECDILGRSLPVQGSFVGIAFGVQDSETYDAVYFRPFNFRSADPDRRAHSVQYVSHPDWTWGRLRQEKPGQFEKAVEPAVDGDRWFHVRIVVEPPKISVFVDESRDPCLTVEALSGPRTGSVALWVGNASPGKFANLKIRSADETAAIERSIRDCIGWAKTKDFERLYGVIADDADFLEVHPDGAVVRGIDEFRKAEAFWGHPDFKAVRYGIRDLKIKLSRSGEVAWFYGLLDDINEWQGKPANWENTRWTGVLEKRDGRWVMVQQHFSFAAGAPAKTDPATVTFVGISGFLIEAGGKKVLIDGLSKFTPPAVVFKSEMDAWTVK